MVMTTTLFSTAFRTPSQPHESMAFRESTSQFGRTRRSQAARTASQSGQQNRWRSSLAQRRTRATTRFGAPLGETAEVIYEISKE